MGLDQIVEREKFYSARTTPTGSPQQGYLRTLAERVVASKGPPARWYHWGPDPDMDRKSFWLLPAEPLALWTPSESYLIEATHGARLGRRGLDATRIDESFDLAREVPAAAALAQVSVAGFFDKARRSKPHITVQLWRLRGEAAWAVDALFDDSHPELKAGADPTAVAAPACDALGAIDPTSGNGRPARPEWPARTGLADDVEAYRIFRAVVEAAIPHPTAWCVSFAFDAFQWGKWTGVLNCFEPEWCFGGDLLPPHGLDPYARPATLYPGRPIRIPLASWKPGGPPRLQMNMVHAVEGSWLEFETTQGRAKLDEAIALVGPLEFWGGPPHVRWAAG